MWSDTSKSADQDIVKSIEASLVEQNVEYRLDGNQNQVSTVSPLIACSLTLAVAASGLRHAFWCVQIEVLLKPPVWFAEQVASMKIEILRRDSKIGMLWGKQL